jgi:tetratricopeptide (TPR) repeat protein
MDGELTMHGVTKPITVPLILPAPRRSPESRWMILTATSTFRLARKDFGITGGDKYNSWFNAARMATMADSVDIAIEVEGWWADAASQRSPGIIAAIQRVKTDGIEAQLNRVRTNLSGKPDSVLMDYFAGPDLLVRELLTEDPAKAVALARGLLSIFKGTWAYAVYGHALAVTGDSAGVARQYAEAKRVFKRRTRDPNEKFPQDDEQWFYLDQLVRTSIELGRIDAAAGLGRLVAELYPGIARASATYGWALSQAGDMKGAAEQFANALLIDPLDTRTMELSRRVSFANSGRLE